MFKTIFALILLAFALNANILHFNKYELRGKKNGDTLLVVGGIHGNEPGGYFAPAILIEHYKILKGNLIVIPNLNFDSDIRNVRGLYKDMNRKFAHISKNDPDYKIVRDIKKIILQKNIDLILNLHDGHGFYRTKWENVIFNPKAWGQALIIDQIKIKNPKYGDLDTICNKVISKINNAIFKKRHVFGIKNTKTKFHDEQMRLSLTYFAITHNKPALAIETSKNIKDLSKKVYYQLLAIEGFMHIMGIKFKRDFRMDQKVIKKLLQKYGDLNINNRFKIDLTKSKPFLNFIPLKKNNNSFVFSHPLGATIRNKNYYIVKIGNKKVTTLKGEYFSFSNIKPKIYIQTGSKKTDISDKFSYNVSKKFKIILPKGFRANVIGYTKKGIKNEANIWIDESKIDNRYSVYKNEKAYRVEFYDNKNRYIKTILIVTKA